MVAKVGTSKAGGTISQQAAVHPWLAVDAHGNKQRNKQTPLSRLKSLEMHTSEIISYDYGSALFWNITQSIVVIPYGRFGTIDKSHPQGSENLGL
jgi:hypothetical protein